VPFFPLGGFTPLQSAAFNAVAASAQATPMQIAPGWLLHRSPNMLLIPGTSSVKHLRENLDAAALRLPFRIDRGPGSDPAERPVQRSNPGLS
jgi:pyridoxine 4-dehydrogenase